MPRFSITAPAFCLFATTAMSTAEAAEVRVLSAGAMRAVVEAIRSDFEKRTGHTLSVDKDTAGGLAKRIGSGASAAKADCRTDAPEQIALLFYFLAYFGETLLDLDRLVLRQIDRNSDTFFSNGCGKAAFELSKLLPDDFKCVLHHGVHAIRVLPC